MTSSDPTDHALAAIASIFDHPVENSEPKISEVSKSDTTTGGPKAADAPIETQASAIDVDHYSKAGPGPIDDIRFRWTARRDEAGNYFVDETIGPNSRPLTSGPMPRESVVRFIDDREREARRRFDSLKTEMRTGLAVTDRPS